MSTIRVDDTRSEIERSVFAGLTPAARQQAEAGPSRSLSSTMPILLVGSIAMTMNATSPITPIAPQTPSQPTSSGAATLASASSGIRVATAQAPATYTVVKGDTISGIAARYGLTTVGVLALNGLSRSSLIFPGQVIKLTSAAAAPVTPVPVAAAPAATPGSYTIVKGDTVSKIAARFGTTTLAVLTANNLGWSTIIYPGQVLTIPQTAQAPVLNAVPVVAVTPVVETPVVETPPPVVAPAVVTPPAPAPVAVNGSYVIQSGDNLTKIAAKFGVTLQSILDANGLSRTSIIYSGKTLVIPGVATTTTAGTSGVTLLQDDQAANALTIVAVGRQLGVSDYGIIVALSAAMQESSLRNISYGHLDSVGLFQQRPSSGWGSIAQLTDPSYAAKLFFGGPSNPNKGKTRGLLDIAGWQSMTVTQAAQRVQISAYPNAYAKWEASARFWLSELG